MRRENNQSGEREAELSGHELDYYRDIHARHVAEWLAKPMEERSRILAEFGLSASAVGYVANGSGDGESKEVREKKALATAKSRELRLSQEPRAE